MLSLEENEIRAIVRLISRVVANPGNHAAKKRFLMDGLCDLIGANAWAWTLSCQRDPDKPQIYTSFLNGGFSEEGLVKVLQAIEHPDMVQIAAKFFSEIQKRQCHLTRLRYQITNKKRFESSGAHLAWKAANVGPTILSLRPLDGRSASVIGLYRHYNKEEFTAREARIAHVVVSEVPWLHEQGWPDDRGEKVPMLSKRQRLTLNLLIQGQSRKHIADNMNISVNTVQEYTKNIYRRFKVNSQAELMHRFLHGDGGDVS